MKYLSTDRLSDFEFHDSEWSYVSWERGNLTVRIVMLNIHKDTEQNDTGRDMEIKEAFATFIGVKNPLYELPRTWQKDENGNSYTNEPRVIYEGGAAVRRFIEDLKSDRVACMFFDRTDEGYEFGGIGDDWISFKLGFDSVRIEWDEYDGKAWYSGRTYQKRNVVLSTPDGDVTLPAFVRECTEPIFSNGVEIAPPCIGIGLDYKEKHYFGGHFLILDEALAGLQAALPEGVIIKNLE